MKPPLSRSLAIRAAALLLTGWPASRSQAVEYGDFSITWDRSTLTLVSERAVYARITRLQSGDLLCCYQRDGQSRVKRSPDEGRTWGGEGVVTDYPHGMAANPELLQKKNGDVLLLYNERPRGGDKPYAISMVISTDEGRSWGESRRLFTAGIDRRTGCWEPAAVQYPDGEVQVFFANEAPYPHSNEQQISMISSRDLSKVHTVSCRVRARDGMPVPLLLKDGTTAVIAIEDSNLNGKMKPVILQSNVAQRWTQGVVTAESPRRRRALQKPLPADVYAGAPYICQLSSGITLLSVQSDEGRREPQMVVYVGDEKARRFTNRSVPFPLAGDRSGLWNSLFAKDADTVTAVSGTTIKGKRGIWIIDGKVKGLEESSP
jgi:hypothetical protein